MVANFKPRLNKPSLNKSRNIKSQKRDYVDTKVKPINSSSKKSANRKIETLSGIRPIHWFGDKLTVAITLAVKQKAKRLIIILAVFIFLLITLITPIRTYINQKNMIQEQDIKSQKLAQEIMQARINKNKLSNSKYIEEQARIRQRLVYPGETAYVIIPPARNSGEANKINATKTKSTPWFTQFWDSVIK